MHRNDSAEYVLAEKIRKETKETHNRANPLATVTGPFEWRRIVRIEWLESSGFAGTTQTGLDGSNFAEYSIFSTEASLISSASVTPVNAKAYIATA